MSSEDAQAAHEEVMQLEGFLDMLENWDEFERDREQQRTPDREEASESGARGGGVADDVADDEIQALFLFLSY